MNRAGVRRLPGVDWAAAELLTDMWAAWKAGDREAALAAIPDEVVDDLVVHGSPATVALGSSATSTTA